MVENINPINNNILARILPDESSSFDYVGSEILAGQRWAEVIKVGPGHPDVAHVSIPMPVSPGDIIYGMAHGFEQVDDDLVILSFFDVLGKLPNKEADMSEFTPMGNLLVVSMEEEQQGKIEALPHLQKRANKGIITKVGTGWYNVNGEIIPLHLQEGDEVLLFPDKLIGVYGKYISKQDLKLISHADVKAILTR